MLALTSFQQILNHMNESAVYNEADLAPFQKRLAALRQIVQQDAANGKHPDALTKLLERQLAECGMCHRIDINLDSLERVPAISESIVKSLHESLSVFSVELLPIHERLVNIRRQLVALAAKEQSHKAELKPLLEELRKIDSLSLPSF
jgi:cytochrome c553